MAPLVAGAKRLGQAALIVVAWLVSHALALTIMALLTFVKYTVLSSLYVKGLLLQELRLLGRAKLNWLRQALRT